jgi:hypothetical protein
MAPARDEPDQAQGAASASSRCGRGPRGGRLLRAAFPLGARSGASRRVRAPTRRPHATGLEHESEKAWRLLPRPMLHRRLRRNSALLHGPHPTLSSPPRGVPCKRSRPGWQRGQSVRGGNGGLTSAGRHELDRGPSLDRRTSHWRTAAGEGSGGSVPVLPERERARARSRSSDHLVPSSRCATYSLACAPTPRGTHFGELI